MASTLTAAGSHIVTLDELKGMADPKASGPRHQPIRHDTFIAEIVKQTLERGYVVTKQQLAVDREGVRLFGALDLVPVGAEKLVGQDDTQIGMSIGVRHANDRTISVGMIAGARVYVCENLSFVGDMVLLRRKHTTNMHLDEEVHDALDRLFTKYVEIEVFHNSLRDRQVSDPDAKQLIYDAFMEQKLLATAHMPEVHGWYFDSGTPDTRPTDGLALFNAFTRTIKGLAPYRVQETTVQVAGYFREQFSVN